MFLWWLGQGCPPPAEDWLALYLRFTMLHRVGAKVMRGLGFLLRKRTMYSGTFGGLSFLPFMGMRKGLESSLGST